MRIYDLILIHYHIYHIYNLTRKYRLLNSSYIVYDMTWYGSNALYLILYGLLWICAKYTAFYYPVWLIWTYMDLYDSMWYLIIFYDLPLLASTYVCLVLTLWMSDSQHTPVVPLSLLVSGKKYSYTILLSITFFDILGILFYWDESNDHVSKLLK